MRGRDDARRALLLIAEGLAEGGTPQQVFAALQNTAAGRRRAALVGWSQRALASGALLSDVLRASGWCAPPSLREAIAAAEEAGTYAPSLRAWLDAERVTEQERAPVVTVLLYAVLLCAGALALRYLPALDLLEEGDGRRTGGPLLPALSVMGAALAGLALLRFAPNLATSALNALPLFASAARERASAALLRTLASLTREAVSLSAALRIAARSGGATRGWTRRGLEDAAAAIDRGLPPAMAVASEPRLGRVLATPFVAAADGADLEAVLEADAADRALRAVQLQARAHATYFVAVMLILTAVVAVALVGAYGQLDEPIGAIGRLP
jgi:type II secretory pathway component PulF